MIAYWFVFFLIPSKCSVTAFNCYLAKFFLVSTLHVFVNFTPISHLLLPLVYLLDAVLVIFLDSSLNELGFPRLIFAVSCPASQPEASLSDCFLQPRLHCGSLCGAPTPLLHKTDSEQNDGSSLTPSSFCFLLNHKDTVELSSRDFPEGPVVGTSPSSASRGRFNPWSGSWALTCLAAKKPKHKTETTL